jgi:hypothetical protein
MLEILIERLTDVVSRRGFVGRTVSACGAIALSVLGLDQVATATKVGCCNLCFPNGGGTYSNCAGEWCWTCCKDSKLYKCSECFIATTSCAGPCDTQDWGLGNCKCTNVKGSHSLVIGNICP